MISPDLSRRTEVEIRFSGVDVTEDIKPYLTSLTYTDSEEDESDDLQIELSDRNGVWLNWLEEATKAAAASKLQLAAVIRPLNWGTEMQELQTGSFELDSAEIDFASGAISIRGTALPFSAPVRQTKKTKAWEKYHLSGIAREVAGNAGLKCVFESQKDPQYKRKEQNKESDIQFLQGLCKDAGVSLKCNDGQLILFDQSKYESNPPIMTIKRNDKTYTACRFSFGSADTQYSSCRVSYTDPATGKSVSGTAKATEEDEETGQVLEITAKVSTSAEAKELAAKRLRLCNKFTRTGEITFPGNTSLVAGVTLQLEDFGGFSGKYIVKQAEHTVSRSGYETRISVRRVLGGY